MRKRILTLLTFLAALASARESSGTTISGCTGLFARFNGTEVKATFSHIDKKIRYFRWVALDGTSGGIFPESKLSFGCSASLNDNGMSVRKIAAKIELLSPTATGDSLSMGMTPHRRTKEASLH